VRLDYYDVMRTASLPRLVAETERLWRRSRLNIIRWTLMFIRRWMSPGNWRSTASNSYHHHHHHHQQQQQHQQQHGCSPWNLGLGLESTRDQFYASLVLVLVLRCEVLPLVLILIVSVLVLVLKNRSRTFSRPVLSVFCYFLMENNHNNGNRSLLILMWW